MMSIYNFNLLSEKFPKKKINNFKCQFLFKSKLHEIQDKYFACKFLFKYIKIFMKIKFYLMHQVQKTSPKNQKMYCDMITASVHVILAFHKIRLRFLI